MKNVLKKLLPITVFGLSTLFAGMNCEHILFVPWGENEQQLKHVSYPGLHTGPQSFQVDGERVIIFDSENKKLKSYDRSGFIGADMLEDRHILDFFKEGDKLYLMHPQYVYVREKGITRTLSHLDDPANMYRGFKKENGGLSIDHEEGRFQCSSPALIKGMARDVRVTRSLPSSLNINMDGKMHSLFVPRIGSVEYLGSRPNNTHYIYVESIIDHAPLNVKRDIYVIDEQANILNILHLPQQKYTYVFKEFIVGDDGELYHMHSAKDGIHILKWTDSDDRSNETDYPAEFSETYHFNDFLEAEPELAELPVLAKSAGEVTRGDALVTADEYVTHVWTATAANIGVTELVTTPSWIQVGQNQRIPYQWGGYSTVAQFDQGIAAGKLAGDITTGATVDLNNAVGADCSGFVSVCWTSGRYSTSSFHYVTYELSSFNDLLPADATNKAGSHIRMVVEWTADGRLTQIEETSSGTPGWAARYYTWRLSDITGYVPIRYNNIQNSLAPRPTLLSVTQDGNNTILSWSCDESTSFSGYRVYRRSSPDSDYTLVCQVPAGSTSASVAQESYVIYDYFVAAYVEGDSANYNASDTYSSLISAGNTSVLIVDGFDRFSGSWGLPIHQHVSTHANALSPWGVAISSTSNEAVIAAQIDLSDYDVVWWVCGDESTADETFNATEQDKVEAYLKQGGKLFVSGSEIAWDLDNKGSTTDKAFIHDFLKASYAADDAGNYHVTGHVGRALEGIDLYYSENGSEAGTYAEDYPDALSVFGGSQVVLKYGNDLNAGIAFSGTFPGGSAEGRVITMGFPFEVIIGATDRMALAAKILIYMGHSMSGVDGLLPDEFMLFQNYPNPFNPSTTIEYDLAKDADVTIRIFDLKGRAIQKIVQGRQDAGNHKLIFNGTLLPSGMYVYGLEIDGRIVEARKMILNK